MKKGMLLMFFIMISFSLNTKATSNAININSVAQAQDCFAYSFQAADMEWSWFYGSITDHSSMEWIEMQVDYFIYCSRLQKKGVEALLPIFQDI